MCLCSLYNLQLLETLVNDCPFVELWNTISDILELGKRKAEDWIHKGMLQLKHNCCPCQQHHVMSQLMHQVSDKAQKQPGASSSQKHFLGGTETAWRAVLCYTYKQRVWLCPSPGNPIVKMGCGRGWALAPLHRPSGKKWGWKNKCYRKPEADFLTGKFFLYFKNTYFQYL